MAYRKDIPDLKNRFTNQTHLSLLKAQNRVPYLYIICCLCSLQGVRETIKGKEIRVKPGKRNRNIKTIYSLTIVTPYSKTSYTRLLLKNEEQSFFYLEKQKIKNSKTEINFIL
jgi:hypothetical protein